MHLSSGFTLLYLLAAVLFIIGLHQLSSPKHARSGNLVAALGALIAVVATIVVLHHSVLNWVLMALAILVGIPVGAVAARAVKMTAMPQMVATFNGVGGGAAALVAIIEFLMVPKGTTASLLLSISVVFAVVIGAVSFSGSGVAFAKLQELMRGTPLTYPGQQPVNGAVAAAIVILGVLIVVSGVGVIGLWVLLLLALVLGVAFVLPIGGADMPVVISMLNAFTGLAVAGDGFVLGLPILVVGGTLVGASGTFLTKMMSDNMGRSLGNLLFGAFGKVQVGAETAASGQRSVHSGSAEDIGTLLAYSQRVIIVPGYGLAVAQAQHVVRDLADALEKRGVSVDYAIHPVAGRMPGHMNVLLAEANIPYEQLKDMDEINDDFKSADVALVVGANDVVNPAARNSPGSPIFGMPILNADQAKNIIFMKRSMRPGFAGIDNELLYDPKTIMLFGDAKDSLTQLVAAVKAA
ncbi:MAG: NAD(P)(+) transhydrogenase (Re/Si-specific) subunit beta [Candidatus Dormibacteraeota bacterium]|nr:NAD(P)(+) transhydrogenase (Re/Si-specific) subunit beta [Candidatus Dormibacteraeota bacterium]